MLSVYIILIAFVLALDARSFDLSRVNPRNNVDVNVTMEHLYYHKKRPESWWNTTCNHNKYKELMKPVWDVFLKNPDDVNAAIEFEKVLKESKGWTPIINSTQSFWNSICFSRSLEMCNRNNLCDCMTDFRIEQVMENIHCGVIAKQSCKPWERQTKRKSKQAPKLSIDCEINAACNNEQICECAVGLRCSAAVRKHLLFPYTVYFVNFVSFLYM